jgi:hypothetical protein
LNADFASVYGNGYNSGLGHKLSEKVKPMTKWATVAVVLLIAFWPGHFASAADKDAKSGVTKVAGILIDKGTDWLTVTDFERHRIKTMRKNLSKSSPARSASATPPKK